MSATWPALVPGSQEGLTHTVPDAQRRHAASPSQVPSRPQLDCSSEAQWASGSLPAPTDVQELPARSPSSTPEQVRQSPHSPAGSVSADSAVHTPSLPLRSQATHSPSQAVSQQSPSMQCPLRQSWAPRQKSPSGRLHPPAPSQAEDWLDHVERFVWSRPDVEVVRTDRRWMEVD